MKRTILYVAAALIAFSATATMAEAGRKYHNGDRYGSQHATYDEIARRLENDPWMKVHATEPNGQRVFILLDNTGNVIRVTPLSDQVAEH